MRWRIILSGRRIDAAHALRIGLVNRIVPAADLVAETMEFAALVASRAPLAQRFAKDVMLRSFDMPLADGAPPRIPLVLRSRRHCRT